MGGLIIHVEGVASYHTPPPLWASGGEAPYHILNWIPANICCPYQYYASARLQSFPYFSTSVAIGTLVECRNLY